jgi:hypothetical protein
VSLLPEGGGYAEGGRGMAMRKKVSVKRGPAMTGSV